MALNLLIDVNLTRAFYIGRLYQDLQDTDIHTLGSPIIEDQLGTLETSWTKFDSTHDKLIEKCQGNEDAQNHPYFKDQVYRSTIDKYQLARQCLQEVRSNRRGAHSAPPSPSRPRPPLPPLRFTRFSGQYVEWRAFRDSFTAVVGSVSNLPNAVKMHFLQTHLTGEAAQMISSLVSSDDSFTTAWNLLLSRYNNRRLLISAHLDQLLHAPAMSSHSSAELHALITRVTNALSSLAVLRLPIQHWDQPIISSITHQLSSQLREAWEIELSASAEVPTLARIMNFLRVRARAMEIIEATPASRLNITRSSDP